MDLETDFFTLFNLPHQFTLDTAALTARYRQLQREFHPDRYVTASAHEQRLALQFAVYLNQGLEVLTAPVKRAEYLLTLAGVELRTDNLASDPKFLMQQIAWREELADIAKSDDAERQLVAFGQEITEQQKQYEQQFEDLLAAKDFSKAPALLSKMQFINKLLIELEQIEDQLLLG